MAAGWGVRAWLALALLASVMIMLGIVGMHMLPGGHGSAAGRAHPDRSTAAMAGESMGHGDHESVPSAPSAVAGGDVELSCAHQSAHEECVLSLSWAAVLAAVPPAPWRPIWLAQQPVAHLVGQPTPAPARVSPSLLLRVCRT